MDRQNRSKLNLLLSKWPRGAVATTPWLEKQGISRQLADQYRKSRWIESLGRGAFKRVGDDLTWEGALYAVQFQLQKKIRVGGKSALALFGLIHCLEMGKKTVWLFGPINERLPAWFRSCDLKTNFEFFTTNLFSHDKEIGLEESRRGAFSVKISSPERAMMEVLYLVPQRQSYEESALLMEGLSALRPGLVCRLLKLCRSVKVKRLFMVLAEKFNYPWFARLDVSGVDFGKGKRVVVAGGHLHPRYHITIPKET